jgi:hypothetical protein
MRRFLENRESLFEASCKVAVILGRYKYVPVLKHRAMHTYGWLEVKIHAFLIPALGHFIPGTH